MFTNDEYFTVHKISSENANVLWKVKGWNRKWWDSKDTGWQSRGLLRQHYEEGGNKNSKEIKLLFEPVLYSPSYEAFLRPLIQVRAKLAYLVRFRSVHFGQKIWLDHIFEQIRSSIRGLAWEGACGKLCIIKSFVFPRIKLAPLQAEKGVKICWSIAPGILTSPFQYLDCATAVTLKTRYNQNAIFF